MTEKTRIEIALLLPTVPDARAACVKRLEDLLTADDGIKAAHLAGAGDQDGTELCIHYEPTQLSIGEVRTLVKRAGLELEKRFGHLLLNTQPKYARRSQRIESRVKQIAGVLEVAASPGGALAIEFDRRTTDEAAIRVAVRRLGVRLLPTDRSQSRQGSLPETSDKHLPGATSAAVSEHHHSAAASGTDTQEHAHVHGGLLGERTEIVFAAICGGLLSSGWLLSMLTDVTPWVPWSMYLAAYVFGGVFMFRDAIHSILTGRFDIDFLMLVAAVGAATLGKWAEGALLLFLFSLGHALEHFAMGRAKRAIEALAGLTPQTAIVRRDGQPEEIPVEQLRPGDLVLVKPNERMPADGFVIKGQGSVNQAPITGESMPVDKRSVEDPQSAAANPDGLAPQHRIFAGTINQSNSLEIQVTRLSSESTLARVVQMVSEAETQKSPTQRFADRFERYFVPTVLAFVVLLLFAWTVIDETFGTSFYRAMAVLVAASPCALAISTPSAVLSGVARAARGGVLIKGGGPLENLGTVGAIAFDKTGTLTEGKPRLTDVLAAEGVTEDELLNVAIAVEKISDHPLAAAVVRDGYARIKNVSDVAAQDVQSITGRGVKATVDGQPVHIGKEDLFSEIEGVPIPAALRRSIEQLKANGRTTMVVRHGDEYLGVLGLMDTPREAAKRMIASLRALGIGKMIMLSGDNQEVASAVAKEVGIDEAMGDLMPEGKVLAIKTLNREVGVAMVGDGVNDAPALASATVGITMGAAGSDVALETADVALMADDLDHLPFVVGLSRQTSRIIRQNLWLSLGMVAFLVPATVLGLQLGPAVLLHEGSTVLVVFNALRLLGYSADAPPTLVA